ncbi:tetratricopeptide repeat protein [Dankookia sp. P2]|uniref:tetratricopeptide repeat protein n=1 Tax=Dankookia sp. P2 TaxID=3423955 RepID=UPI003D668671
MPGRPAAATPAQPALSEAGLRLRLAMAPDNAAHWQQLGQHCAAAGRPAEAAEAFGRAKAAGASALALAVPHALALSDAGRAEEALAVALAAQAKRPKDFLLTNLLGIMQKRAGRLTEAQAAFEVARKLDPRAVSACQNLGNLHDQLGRFREAAAAYQAGLKIEPRNVHLLRLLGRTLRTGGDRKAAVVAFERALALGRPDLDLLTDLVGTLIDLGEHDRAFAVLERGRQLRGADPRVDILQARLTLRLGRPEEARVLVEQALAAAPGDADGAVLLARLHGEGNLEAANAALRQGLAANPDSVVLVTRLIENLTRSRYGDEAQHLQEAYELSCGLLQSNPGAALAHAKPLRTAFLRCVDHDRLDASGRLADLAPRWIADGEIAALHYELGNVCTLQDRLDIVEWHRAWGRREAQAITPLSLPVAPALATGRKLRIGFMSSDLRDHPVTYFALPLLEQYDRDRIEVYCYSFNERERDRVQAHIEQQVTGFRWWPRRPSAEVAAGIAEDGLDILFEARRHHRDEQAGRHGPSPGADRRELAGLPAFGGAGGDRHHPRRPLHQAGRPAAVDRTAFRTARKLGGAGPARLPGGADRGRPAGGAPRRADVRHDEQPVQITRACLDAWAAVLRAVPESAIPVRPA